MPAPLPIDPLLPQVVEALRAGSTAVIEAPPGAGKTTRVPRAILEAGLAGSGEVVVLEPRRLAARLAARRVAEEMGQSLGETVGYQVRFEDVSGPRTRLRYLTEGLLTRRLLTEPNLPGVGAVVLDEFHERNLPGDLALTLLRHLQRGKRPDLKLVAMSATLDAGPVARYLAAPVLRSEGRSFPVEIEHLEKADDRKLEVQVAGAVRRALREGPEGDVLVFLPGAAEIRRAREALEAAFTGRDGPLILPLHGDLSVEEQDRAVRPAAGRRKVILSTNVAESSVTIEGVTVVVDAGLARVASHSPWSGLPRLELRKVSRASATQRAGRAGRTAPGRALRLYTRHDHDARPAHDPPEIQRLDLADTLLALASLGIGELEWLDAPPAPALEAARALLADLGALEPGGAVTERGRRMLRLPVHPRLARLVVEADERGSAEAGCLIAALLGERDIRERGSFDPGRRRGLAPTGPSDLLELVDLFREAEGRRFSADALRSAGLNPGAVQTVDRQRKQLLRLVGGGRAGGGGKGVAGDGTATKGGTAEKGGAAELEEALLASVAAAYPDRVARRRSEGSADVVLAGGGSAKLAEESVVREASILIAVDVEERSGQSGGQGPGGYGPPAGRSGAATVRLASAASAELLLDLFPAAMRYEQTYRWNAQGERVEAVERLMYRDLMLEEERVSQLDPARAAEVLATAALEKGPRAFAPEGELDRWANRLAFLARFAPDSGIAAPDEAALKAALRALCEGRRSFADLKQMSLVDALRGGLAPAQLAQVERLAPDRVTLPGGRSVRVEYPPGDAPYIESRLQDFFGMATGPALAGGRAPLVLHLLAPNQRAVQVTTDLAGFWERHYPALRKELSRRYPRHSWPDDPLRAQPPAPRPPRRR
jgi:ATP-dependent helicase HrpB